VDESNFCREGWRHGSSQTTQGALVSIVENDFFGFPNVFWLQLTDEAVSWQIYKLCMSNFLRISHNKKH